MLSRQHVVRTCTKVQQRQEDEDYEEESVIRRKNAQRAPRVKRLEVARAATRVHENSGNEESGKDEKEIDSRPARVRNCDKDPRGTFGSEVKIRDEVRRDYQQDRYSPQPVECEDVATFERSIYLSGRPIHGRRYWSCCHASTLWDDWRKSREVAHTR